VAASAACATGADPAGAGLAWSATHTAPLTTAMPWGLWPSRTVRVTRAASGSMRATVPPRRLVTHTAPAPTAIPAGPPAMRTVSVTALDAGSIRLTRSSSGTATQTPPAPTAMPLALSPTAIVSTLSFVRESILVTVPSVLSLTHTAPAPTASPLGALPTGIVATTRRVSGSSRAISAYPYVIHTASAVTATGRTAWVANPDPSAPIGRERATLWKAGSITRATARALSATQTPLGPAASPSTLIPGEIVPAKRRERAPICVTVLSARLATHTEPAPTARSAGRRPTGT
jgi:hypothetical protein